MPVGCVPPKGKAQAEKCAGHADQLLAFEPIEAPSPAPGTRDERQPARGGNKRTIGP
jgi:hypothetical protein